MFVMCLPQVAKVVIVPPAPSIGASTNFAGQRRVGRMS